MATVDPRTAVFRGWHCQNKSGEISQSVRTTRARAVKVASLVRLLKYWPHKYEDLNSTSRTHVKKLTMVAGTCNPSSGEAETRSPGTHWPVSE